MAKQRFQFWQWEQINRHEGELYLERLRLLVCPWFGLYIHWFHASDDDSLHDHPWPFLTVLLTGGYWEHTPGPNGTVLRRWHPPFSVRMRPARWLHRVEIDAARKPVTVVLRGAPIRRWGFQTRAGWIPWPEYKDRKVDAPSIVDEGPAGGSAARGETPRCTEIGDAPAWQGATREQIGAFVTEELSGSAGFHADPPTATPPRGMQRETAEFCGKRRIQRESNAVGLSPRAARQWLGWQNTAH